ncbi:MAG: hypothetical protein M0Z41_08575 [Peptococcaceae bacterium]|jgi:hypothetical protein|nr:hypothetical protein [Peptococcaceae bacterium]
MFVFSAGAALLAALSIYLLLAPEGALIRATRKRTPSPAVPGYRDLAREVLGISKARMTLLEVAGVVAVGAVWAFLTDGNWSFILAAAMLGRGVSGFTVEMLASARLQKLDRMTADYQTTVTGALSVGMTVPKALEAAGRSLSREAKSYLGAVTASKKPAIALDEAAAKLHSNHLRLFSRLIDLSQDKGVTISCFERHDRKQREEEQVRTDAALDVAMFLYLYTVFLALPPAAFLFDRLAEPSWYAALIIHLKWWIWLTVPMEAFVFSGLRKFSRLRVGLGRITP